MKQDLSIPVITIDGGAGTGTSTQRALIARLLGFHSLDSGVLYRAVGFKVYTEKIPLEDVTYITSIAHNLDIVSKGESVLLDGIDQTLPIRSDEIGGKYSALVAKIPQVREALHFFQISRRKAPGLVADGRDQGIVFDTPYRFFLETKAEKRAERRVRQFQKMKLPADYETILAEIIRRDNSDKTNPANPLRPHPKAMVIDNSDLAIKETARLILCMCQLKKPSH